MKKILVSATVLCLLLFSAQTALAVASVDGTTWELGAIMEDEELYEPDERETIQFMGNGAMVWTDSSGAHDGTYEQFDDTVGMGIFGDYFSAQIVEDSGNTFLVVEETWVFVLTQSGSSGGGQSPNGGGTQQPDETDQQPSGGGSQQQDGTQGIIDFLTKNWWLLVAVVGGGIVVMRKRKNKTPASSAEVPPAYPPAASEPIPVTMPVQQPAASGASSHLICTKGHYAGATFPVNGRLAIGRDPKRCQLVFPSETKGISSLHCEITQQAYGVTLADMGSTYGTFLMGRKLNANESVTLNPGDSFHLADGKNEFKVL